MRFVMLDKTIKSQISIKNKKCHNFAEKSSFSKTRSFEKFLEITIILIVFLTDILMYDQMVSHDANEYFHDNTEFS